MQGVWRLLETESGGRRTPASKNNPAVRYIIVGNKLVGPFDPPAPFELIAPEVLHVKHAGLYGKIHTYAFLYRFRNDALESIAVVSMTAVAQKEPVAAKSQLLRTFGTQPIEVAENGDEPATWRLGGRTDTRRIDHARTD